MAEGKESGGFFDKLYERYAKEYAMWFIAVATDPGQIVERTREVRSEGRLGEYLMTVLTVSVFLGITIGALIPDRPPIKDRAVVFVVVSLLWVFQSLLVHFVCRLFGGREEATTSVSLMVQDLAFVYVASNFLTLLVAWVAATYQPVYDFLTKHLFFDGPGMVLFTFQFLLLLYLVPLTVSYAHGFRGVKWFVTALFAGCFALFFGVPVFAMHSC